MVGGLYLYNCDHCGSELEIMTGCGFGGCMETHHCSFCGRLHERWTSIEEMQENVKRSEAGQDEPTAPKPVKPPACPEGHGAMEEFDPDPGDHFALHCNKCRKTFHVAGTDIVGIWD